MTTTIKEQNGEIMAFFEGSLDTAAAQKTEKDIQPLLTADKNRGDNNINIVKEFFPQEHSV